MKAIKRIDEPNRSARQNVQIFLQSSRNTFQIIIVQPINDNDGKTVVKTVHLYQ